MAKDPEFFEKPDEFYPDHFSEEAVNARGPFPDSSFGHGPRNCIGKRFALLQLKVAMFKLLANYKVVPCDRTPKKLVMDNSSAQLLPKGGMWVKIVHRE